MNLLVGIDTEGDNQWDAAARANQQFENIYALPRLHALFAKHGVRPTYVVTYPVVRDARSAEVLGRLLAAGDCEIGAHHHAWETPPCSQEDVHRHPYASTLPRSQFEAQLASLTGAIAAAVGFLLYCVRHEESFGKQFALSISESDMLKRADQI